jgi:hypothetical protein
VWCEKFLGPMLLFLKIVTPKKLAILIQITATWAAKLIVTWVVKKNAKRHFFAENNNHNIDPWSKVGHLKYKSPFEGTFKDVVKSFADVK